MSLPARNPDEHGTHSPLSQEHRSSFSALLPIIEQRTTKGQTLPAPESPIPQTPIVTAHDPTPPDLEILPARDPDNSGLNPPPVHDLASSPSTQLSTRDLPTLRCRPRHLSINKPNPADTTDAAGHRKSARFSPKSTKNLSDTPIHPHPSKP